LQYLADVLQILADSADIKHFYNVFSIVNLHFAMLIQHSQCCKFMFLRYWFNIYVSYRPLLWYQFIHSRVSYNAVCFHIYHSWHENV